MHTEGNFVSVPNYCWHASQCTKAHALRQPSASVMEHVTADQRLVAMEVSGIWGVTNERLNAIFVPQALRRRRGNEYKVKSTLIRHKCL